MSSIMWVCATAVMMLQAAQTPQPQPLPVEGPIRPVLVDLRSGVIVCGDETWNMAAISGESVVYDNTCFYSLSDDGYAGLPSQAVTGGSDHFALIDIGRIPDPASPTVHWASQPGCATSYEITSLQLGYCTRSAAPTEIVLRFFFPVSECESPFQSGAPEIGSLVLGGLPSSPAQGTTACYLVDVVGIEGLVLPGSASQTFGWSFQIPSTGGQDGPLFGGDIFACRGYWGTIWDPDQPTPEEGTGMGNFQDKWVEEPFLGPEQDLCWQPGGSFTGMYLELRSATPCPGPGLPFCVGTASACPCANEGTPLTGCDNAQSTGGVGLEASAFSPDGMGGGTATMSGTGFPPAGAPGVVLLRSPSRESPPVLFGDGLRCVALPGLVRVKAGVASAGTVALDVAHGAGAGTFAYQLWYRNTPAGFCTPAAFNLSNGYELVW